MRGGCATRLGALIVSSLIGFALAEASRADDGFRLSPKVGWSSGEHHLDLGFSSRYRLESFRAFTSSWDTFHSFRTRLGGQYRYGDLFRLVAQGQHTAVVGLGADTSGTGALYRSNSRSGDSSNVDAFYLSQLYAELGADIGWVRAGREFVKEGTYVDYEEPEWRYLKGTRVAQRLLGTVGWTAVERAYDGAHGLGRFGGHTFHAFLLEPTTGVIDVERGYRRNRDIVIGGLDYTLGRETWRKDTELGAFFMVYEDHRNAEDVSGLFGDIDLYTLGARWLGIYPLGAGRIDALLWGAFQFGDYVDQGSSGRVRTRDQRAGALIAELGYERPDLWASPHLRAGVNYASGDDDPDDGTRNTFFNLLPTNHGFYGNLDQFAFQNLVDVLVQLRLEPLTKLSLELAYHRFWLAEKEDFRWAGTGAFSTNSLGYARNPSNGSTDAGHEIDLSATVPVHHTTSLKTGYSRLWGGDVFGNDDEDWFWVQLEVQY